MGKLIFFLIIIGAVYFLFFKKPEVQNSNKQKTSNKNNDSEELIMCDQCKTFTPKSEIKKINGKNICKDCYDNS